MNIVMVLCFGRPMLLILFLTLLVGASPQNKYKEIADCSSKNTFNDLDELIFVSTLDGRLTALNGFAGGILSWSIDTGPGPLLASSIQNLEFTNNGHWVRMIPSLSGGLYKFDGKTIETVPVTAEFLLQSSSFLLRDGLVVSGGKESRTYGVALDSGQVLYECSMKGCDNYTFNNMSDNVIIIRRHTQTVRAVEIKSGNERWNFSVGQHEVKLTFDPNNCQKSKSRKWLSDIHLKASLPDGIVCAVQKSTPQDVVWKHKFNAPVVAVWSLEDGKMTPVDLFEFSESYTYNLNPSAPALYIGVHNKQMYVQESIPLQHSLRKLTKPLLLEDSWHNLRIPWKPISALSTEVAGERLISGSSNHHVYSDIAPTTALSELDNPEYINGNGYYLFIDDTSSKGNLTQCNATILNITVGVDGNTSTYMKYFGKVPILNIVTFQSWWKEVLVILICTVVINLIVAQRFLQHIQNGSENIIQNNIIVVEKPVPAEVQLPSEKFSNNIIKDGTCFEYTSRYLFDFEPIRCLGKGGFGVVFEAKNKIDECNYAIKRIALPNSQESRDRVMREVKALAKLDHQNIVRYFNAWMECPPPGWLEEHDALYFKRNDDATFDFSESVFSSHNVKKSTYEEKSSSLGNRADDINLQIQNGIVDSEENCDSFIVFEHSQKDNSVSSGTDSSENSSVLQKVITHKSSQSVSSCKEALCETNFHSKNECRERCCSLSKNRATKLSSPPTRMYLYIQMQLCLRDSLQKWLSENSKTRDRQKMLQMFEQIVQAVEYIHLEGLIHRDLKPSNIFFSVNGQIKVGDFGLVTPMVKTPPENGMFSENRSYVICEKHTDQVGTQLYMSPEQMKGEPYDYKVDIYSLGLILFELLYPFSTEMERIDTLLSLRRNEFPLSFVDQYEEEHNLLRLMLSHCPQQRPTTFGIRARPPLSDTSNVNREEKTSNEWHFELPSRRRNSSKSSSLSSNCSFEGNELLLLDL